MFHWKCKDCGTLNETSDLSKKVCAKCALNHDGLTDEEAAEARDLALAAKDDGVTVEEEKKKRKSKA